ncbi:iron complex transport system permease protein [Micromonospora phaseoli]|uniref:Iron complex transport system permease protein n=1 Tax=Micromonospora phaseoli TaxID=1144548 RepID=A0A1H6UZJ4_9ACTN|nr:iron ABC transporter permease [Micromonospora phaseoli]PZV93777.1 iron complex transport system permease protein [Micromonospora phaseoli]GIJ79947.1 ABC transporter permease [Micromonospora phaseoli]SEI97779.1 iron complex transport system permease protein [Micromonospora phaseoli]
MTATARPESRPDLLGVAAQRRRTGLWLLALTIGLVLTGVAAVGSGAVGIPPTTVARIIGHHLVGLPAEVTWTPPQEAIVWQVRLPRVLLGMLVGAGLAACGVALQAMVRNVLADPYLLGINSGASSGAAAAILFGVGAGFGQYALSTSAFLGALGASLLVFLIARSGGRVTSIRLLLSGVAVGYALYATTSFLIFASGSAEGARSVMFWLLGSLGLARWNALLLVAAVVLGATIGYLTVVGRRLDVLAIGDETAQTLGVSPDRFRLRLLVLVSLSVGVLVSAAGSIGFVGLVVPHLARRIVGAPHVRVVPVAALLGAILLVWADVLARVLLAPQEIPIGIITALLGAPFLLVLIRRLHA